MPVDTPMQRKRDDPALSSLETGDSVLLNVTHNTEADRDVTATVQRTTQFGGGTELTLHTDHGELVKVYGDHYPPIVEQDGHAAGRLERIQRA